MAPAADGDKPRAIPSPAGGRAVLRRFLATCVFPSDGSMLGRHCLSGFRYPASTCSSWSAKQEGFVCVCGGLWLWCWCLWFSFVFFNVRKHLECLFIFLYSLYNDCIPMVRQFAGSCCSFLLQPYFQMLHSCPVLWSAGTHSWVTLNCPLHGLRPQRVQKAWTETEER